MNKLEEENVTFPRLRLACIGVAALLAAACSGDGGGGTSTIDAATTAADAATNASDIGESADSGAADAGPSCGQQTGARPSRRSEHMGAFDPVSSKLVIFGGSFAVPENCGFPASTFETETWVYDTACDLWHEVKGPTPPARARGMAAHRDAGETKFMVLTGGRSRAGKSGPYKLHDDLWAFNYETEAWLELSQSKTRPKARANAAMVHAKKLDALLMFSGNLSTSGLQIVETNDAWRYDFSTSSWAQLNAGTPPKARLWAASLWDDKRQQMVVFGGGDKSAFANTAKYMNDLWALQVGAGTASWERLDIKSSDRPDARFWADLAYDAQNDRYLMFGGHDDKALGNRNDLWAFSPNDGQWLVIHVADTVNKPANGFCSFPPDFTKMDDFSPERRYAGVFSAGPKQIWLHGGKTDCGVIDDLFRLDLSTYKWQEVTISTVGNSCVRKGGLKCNDYCF